MAKNKNLDKIPFDFFDKIGSRQYASRYYQTEYLNLIQELPDLDPVLRAKGKDISIYRDLLIDPHLSAMLEKRKAGVLSLEWTLTAGDSSARTLKFFKNYFGSSQNIDIYNIINQVLDCLYFGYQPFVIFWDKREDGFLIPRLEDRPQEYFFYDKDNQLRIRTKPGYIGILPEPFAFLVARNKPTYRNPYGEKLASRIFWPITFKKGGLKFWLTMSEKYGTPFIIGKQPRSTKKADAEKLADILNNMVQDAIAVINNDEEIDIKSDPFRASSSSLYSELVSFCNAEISKAVLTVANTSELGSVGSYAATKTQKEGEDSVNLSDIKIVETFFNTLISWTNTINFGNTPAPMFKLFEEEQVEKERSERDNNLQSQGVRFTREYYKTKYNLLDTEFELDDPAPSPPRRTDNQFKESTSFLLGEIESGIPDSALQLQMQQSLKPVFELISSTQDYGDLLSKIAALYPEMKTTQLESLLQKAIFYAEIFGRFDASKN